MHIAYIQQKVMHVGLVSLIVLLLGFHMVHPYIPIHSFFHLLYTYYIYMYHHHDFGIVAAVVDCHFPHFPTGGTEIT